MIIFKVRAPRRTHCRVDHARGLAFHLYSCHPSTDPHDTASTRLTLHNDVPKFVPACLARTPCLCVRVAGVGQQLLSTGFIAEINGCISTGKEANVYYAKSGDGQDLAIKVFKTSILVFKDRDRYVTGEFRFRQGYCKSNPRKMVKVWAEKEMRNLKRLSAAGIVCPEVLLLKQHVLVMTFIGRNGWPAPRLKDAGLDNRKLRDAYLQCIKMMRNMYHKCKLVHGDLSEYNLLWYKSTLYFIDVSQSVEHDHPHAFEFLRKDCMNVTAFFTKGGVGAMYTQELFDFVIDGAIADEDVDAFLDNMQEKISDRPQQRTVGDEVSLR